MAAAADLPRRTTVAVTQMLMALSKRTQTFPVFSMRCRIWVLMARLVS